MACCTGLSNVRTLKWEIRVAMVERRGTPRSQRVALRTIMRELICTVAGIRRAVEISAVTLPAIGIDQIVIAGRVAFDAGLSSVRSRQRKLSRCMIER